MICEALGVAERRREGLKIRQHLHGRSRLTRGRDAVASVFRKEGGTRADGTDWAYAAWLGIVESSEGSCRRKVASDHCGGRHGRLRSGQTAAGCALKAIKEEQLVSAMVDLWDIDGAAEVALRTH